MKKSTSLPTEFLPRIQSHDPGDPGAASSVEAEDGAVFVYDRVKGKGVFVPDEGMAKRLATQRVADEKAALAVAKAKEEADAKAAELAGVAPKPPVVEGKGVDIAVEEETISMASKSKKPGKKK